MNYYHYLFGETNCYFFFIQIESERKTNSLTSFLTSVYPRQLHITNLSTSQFEFLNTLVSRVEVQASNHRSLIDSVVFHDGNYYSPKLAQFFLKISYKPINFFSFLYNVLGYFFKHPVGVFSSRSGR